MKRNLAKAVIIGVVVLVLGFGLVFTTVNADSVYDSDVEALAVTDDIEYSLEEMLNYAIQDEYLAKAEYELIISEFGQVKPFTNIVNAEQTHIDLLVPLFETYGFVLPENNAADSVVLPESITSALATGVEAEQVNIAMYQVFLGQDNLPDDVRAAFEYLVKASQHHLAAFSNDRYGYYGQDMMNKFQNGIGNMFRKGGQGNGNSISNQGQNSQGNGRNNSSQGHNGQGNGRYNFNQGQSDQSGNAKGSGECVNN